jgi:hypothetical protein
MKYFESKHIQVLFDEEAQAGIGNWNGFVSGDEYKLGLNKGIELIKEKKLYKWIGNLSHMEAITEEDQAWANEVWFPNALGAGLKRLGVVVSKDIFNQMSVEEMLNKVESIDLETQYFDSLENAVAWMKTQ